MRTSDLELVKLLVGLEQAVEQVSLRSPSVQVSRPEPEKITEIVCRRLPIMEVLNHGGHQGVHYLTCVLCEVDGEIEQRIGVANDSSLVARFGWSHDEIDFFPEMP